jgi:hypothetical protein
MCAHGIGMALGIGNVQMLQFGVFWNASRTSHCCPIALIGSRSTG